MNKIASTITIISILLPSGCDRDPCADASELDIPLAVAESRAGDPFFDANSSTWILDSGDILSLPIDTPADGHVCGVRLTLRATPQTTIVATIRYYEAAADTWYTVAEMRSQTQTDDGPFILPVNLVAPLSREDVPVLHTFVAHTGDTGEAELIRASYLLQ